MMTNLYSHISNKREDSLIDFEKKIHPSRLCIDFFQPPRLHDILDISSLLFYILHSKTDFLIESNSSVKKLQEIGPSFTLH